MVSRFIDHVMKGAHTARPASSATPVGAMFSCTTHNVIYRNASTGWEVWSPTGVLLLDAGASVPSGTPTNTLIYTKD